MSDARSHSLWSARTLLWVARITAVLAILPLMLMLVGESGTGPQGAREWAYLALFPGAFSASYLLGWWRPLLGGCASLVALVASLVVIGRVFPPAAYVVWAVFSLPGVLYVISGLLLRPQAAPERRREY